MSSTIRIGTRDSELALWQANTVKNKLEALGYKTTLVPVKSDGDLKLDQPLYQLGITGIFTKTLDVALLNGTIDIAVHSLKDVPTALPKGIVQAAVLERGNTSDVLLHKGLDFLESTGLVATGSLRRKAQWLHRYPKHRITDLRGNVNTRLQKLADHPWDGAIFAAAGLERINLLPKNSVVLNWMIPAPAQGAMMIACKEDHLFTQEAVSTLNHRETELCTSIERAFLKTLEGGCTAPIGALAYIVNDTVHFNGVLFALDGSTKFTVQKKVALKDAEGLGVQCALTLLDNGGADLMKDIKAQMK